MRAHNETSAQRMKLRALGTKKERRDTTKEYAAAFYASKAWDDTRKAYMQQQHYICERCGEPAKIVHHKRYISRKNINDASITLGWDNLEALCQDCHNKEHHRQRQQQRYAFDEDGNVLPKSPH